MNIEEFRKQFPQYDSVDDDTLSRKLHAKYYPDTPYEAFASKFLVRTPTIQEVLRGRTRGYQAVAKQAEEAEQVRQSTAGPLDLVQNPESGFSLAGQGPSGGVTRVVTPSPATFSEKMTAVFKGPGPMETKQMEAGRLVREQVKADADALQKAVQNDTDRKAFIEEAEKQRSKFGGKTWNRWDRGSAMVVGGGLHVAEELTRLVTLGKRGDTLAEWTDMYSDVLNRPEMQPVVDNAFDKWIGGGVESAPFLASTLIPGGVGTLFAGTKYAAVASALVKGSNFLTSYGVESNLVYQTAKHSGKYSEEESRIRGVLAGLINAGIEVHGGSGEKYFKQEVIEAATKKLGRTRYFGRKVLRNALSEGLAEEMPQEAVSMVLGGDTPRTPDGKIDWGKVADRLIDAGLMGTIMGGLVSAPITGYQASKLPSFTEVEQVPVSSEAMSIPGRTYQEARLRAEDGTNGKNPWIKMDRSKTNANRVLLIQFASDLLTAGKEDPAAKAYYDKLYAQRPGYVRLGDTWEIPKWITEAANFVPGADVYFVRDMAEAKQFLKSSGYQKVMASALDITTPYIQELTKDFGGKVIVGGYVNGKSKFAGQKNVTWYDSMPDMAKGEGYTYKPGVNVDHFEGSTVMPRLCMSKGCKHHCAFCVVTKKFEETPADLVEQQTDAFGKLDAKFVYLDDKTFGQAKNHTMLPDLYWRIKKKNPEFDGFIVQTTAAQFGKFSDEFLANAHIKYVEFGVESYNDEILGSLKKPHNTKMIDAAAAKARRLRINVIPNIVIGIPQETAETYARTMAWLEANADIISHVNAYNLALYEGTEITKQIVGEGGKIKEEDLNENITAKSFHKDPQLVLDFAAKVYEFSNRMLDHAPVSDVGLTVDQEVAKKYGVTPGQADVLLKQAEDRYRELKAKKTEDRKGKPARVRPVYKTEEPKPLPRPGYLTSPQRGLVHPIASLSTNELIERSKKASPYRRRYLEELALRHKEGRMKATRVKASEQVVAATGEHAELAFLSRSRNDIEAILADITSKNPVTTLKLNQKPETTRPRNELLAMGHGIPQQLGLTEGERRELMTDLTGKDSMKAMSIEEMEQYVDYLELMLKDAGQVYEPKPAVYFEMMDRMQNEQKPEDLLTASLREDKTVKGFFSDAWDKIAKGAWDFVRIDRLCEYLDGGQRDGPFTKFFHRRVERSHIAANDGYNADIMSMDEFTKTLGITPHHLIAKRQKVNERLNMTGAQRVTVYMLAMNKAGQQRLESIGFTKQDIQDVYQFMGGPDGKETKLAEYLLNYYQNWWPILLRAAIQVGIDEKTLKQEFLHSPILYSDVPAEEQNDLLDIFEEQNFPLAGTQPERGMLEKRVKKVTGRKLELDCFAIFFNAANKYNRFVNMAPVAQSLNKMLSDRPFAEALNGATRGEGTRMLATWLKHSVRGHGDLVNKVSWRMLAAMREAGMVFGLGWNSLSVVRQILQLFNTVAADAHMLTELPKVIVDSLTGHYADVRKEVMEKSGTVRNRHMEEMQRKTWNSKALAKRYGRKIDMERTSMAALAHFDERTVVVSWKAAYDTAKKYGLPDAETRGYKAVTEEEAIAFADGVIFKNQSMADAVYLPDIMRNGPMAAIYKLFLPFTNQVNNNLNLFIRDNLDPVRKAGGLKSLKAWKKAGPEVFYKYLFTWVLPAMLFGLIKRGRLQRDPKEVLKDIGQYPLAGLFLVSDWVTSMIEDTGKMTAIYESGLDSSSKLAKSVINGAKADTPAKKEQAWRAAMKNAARTVALLGGAKFPGMRGVITAQTLRSAEAGYDMAMGNKEASARRFFYGNYTFEKYNKEEEEEVEGIRR